MTSKPHYPMRGCGGWRTTGRIWWAPLLAGVLAFTPPASQAASYVFSRIDVTGARATEAFGLNNSGEVVGRYNDAVTVHGFLKSGGGLTLLDAPGASGTIASGINDFGTIVGQAFDADLFSHGFVKSGSTYTTLDAPGSVGGQFGTYLAGINNAGQISGGYTDASGVDAGFIYDHGSFTTLGIAGADFFQVGGINSAGDVVGYFLDSAPQRFRGFLYSGGAYSIFDFPGANTDILPVGVNDHGDIVGNYFDAVGLNHAFIETGGDFRAVTIPGAASREEIDGINNRGDIVGFYRDSKRVFHGFSATIPEPATWWMLIIGFGASGGLLRHRRKHPAL